MRAKPLIIAIGFFALAVSIAVTGGCGAGESGTQGIVFANPDIESAVRSTLGKRSEPVYSTDLEDITEISVSLRDDSNLSDLQYFTNLTNLHLWSSRISDISSLSSLTKLTTLSLECNEISDISPLSSLTSLTELYLWSNEIEDISPLSSLTSLTGLYLWNNRITDISPLSSLTNLRELDLWGNEISEVAPLLNNSGLSEGDEVWLGNNRLDLWEDNLDSSQQSEDLTNIMALHDKGLKVHYDRILVRVNFPDENLNAAIKKALGKQPADAVMSSELALIISLDAARMHITDLDGIEYCTNLAYLTLGGNQISDISSLSSLTNLVLLGLEYNRISGISALSSLTSLTQLGLTGNRIEDISALSSLTNLTQLTIYWNPIRNFSPLLDNSGLGEGDQVWLQDSFVDQEDRQSYLEVIDGLRNRGVVIHVVSS